ncbi:patatin-like phospholipase family protein [Ornithinimicrobium tianjinense]|uniref:Phospholipase n=1 Tax=Ornithinimicrobium tianjinense TaxID=1195761 RepID=A0A917FB33_9MICO|nr:patatin-like phospholipase family protein [Ornithinimicrobium tianjinense]GGF58951.1 phospholipase [Ornithinimicrobium tianjinense]
MPHVRQGAPEPHLGLALGGGGARGLCHIGVLGVLEELGIHPDVVSGTSMGGLVGAFVAAGYTAAEMDALARDMRWARLIDWRITGRLMSTRAFETWLEERLPARFEDLELPLVLTASDLRRGQIHYLSEGDLIPAIRATTAYPGFVEPVELPEAQLVDGGILNQIPVDGALFLGARRVLAVNATPLVAVEATGEAPRRHRAAFREIMRSIDVMQAQLTSARLSFYQPDVLLDPAIDGVEIGDFHKAGLAIDAGAAAARERAEDLLRLVPPVG